MAILKTAAIGAGALGLLLAASAATGTGPLQKQWHVDRKLYPKAYGVLASEHLMFPVDQSDWPVKIDRTRQLFIDDYLIASSKGLTRRVHQAFGEFPERINGDFHYLVA